MKKRQIGLVMLLAPFIAMGSVMMVIVARSNIWIAVGTILVILWIAIGVWLTGE